MKTATLAWTENVAGLSIRAIRRRCLRPAHDVTSWHRQTALSVTEPFFCRAKRHGYSGFCGAS